MACSAARESREKHRLHGSASIDTDVKNSIAAMTQVKKQWPRAEKEDTMVPGLRRTGMWQHQ